MPSKHRIRTAVIAATALASIGLGVGTADATPPSGVTGTILSKTTFRGTDYIVREVTIQPGGYTGWHYHDGTVYGLVRSGTLTHDDADCTTVMTYPAGHTLVEPAGPKHVHITRNLGTTPVVLDLLYVLPTGSPLSEDAPAPNC